MGRNHRMAELVGKRMDLAELGLVGSRKFAGLGRSHRLAVAVAGNHRLVELVDSRESVELEHNRKLAVVVAGSKMVAVGLERNHKLAVVVVGNRRMAELVGSMGLVELERNRKPAVGLDGSRFGCKSRRMGFVGSHKLAVVGLGHSRRLVVVVAGSCKMVAVVGKRMGLELEPVGSKKFVELGHSHRLVAVAVGKSMDLELEPAVGSMDSVELERNRRLVELADRHMGSAGLEHSRKQAAAAGKRMGPELVPVVGSGSACIGPGRLWWIAGSKMVAVELERMSKLDAYHG